ncbi:MAG: transcription antitermination factor NusB [Acidobacteriota bacterium]
MSSRVGERRRAREFTLQVLFQLDLAPQDPDTALEAFWAGKQVSDAVRGFTEVLVRGTMLKRDLIDGILASTSHNWRVSRMPVVDRNVLRMASYEFLFETETPKVVIIDEAIEIAKRFSNEAAGLFVNGVLDAVRLRIENDELLLPDDAPSGTGSAA